jgi:hypothetical protein
MRIRSLLMIRPIHFGYNPETAQTNAFQKTEFVSGSSKKATREFDAMAEILAKKGIPLTLVEDLPESRLPDSVFPNNWISTHPEGLICLYPMLNPSRRAEVRNDIPELLMEKFGYIRVMDFRETPGICEGTGSLVFDHTRKLALAVLSPRTEKEKVLEISRYLNYEPVFLEASAEGKPVYHTNVVLFCASHGLFACSEALSDESRNVLQKIYGNNLNYFSLLSMHAFAGNMLPVETEKDRFIILSETAFHHADKTMVRKLHSEYQPVVISIPTIEILGGGSARCMLAEIF